jgi:hypothetical protein
VRVHANGPTIWTFAVPGRMLATATDAVVMGVQLDGRVRPMPGEQ